MDKFYIVQVDISQLGKRHYMGTCQGTRNIENFPVYLDEFWYEYIKNHPSHRIESGTLKPNLEDAYRFSSKDEAEFFTNKGYYKLPCNWNILNIKIVEVD